jgi:predicted O-methyltransferase YrrM
LDYLKYLFLSKSKYGIHSPFVYQLFENVFEKGNEIPTIFKFIENHRSELLKNDQFIEINDFGTGKSVRKSKIASIAASSLMPKKNSQLIYRLIKFFKPKNILELGTSLGVTTLYMSSAKPDSRIISIEGSPEIAKIANSSFIKFNFKNIELVQANFDEILQEKLIEIEVVDLVVFDGNHTKLATLKYFELCLKFCNNETIFIFDDIRWSQEMKEAWLEIINHKSCIVTLDLFFLGIVFFRRQQIKEHFVIRF